MLRTAGHRPSFHAGGTLKQPFKRRGDIWRRVWGIQVRAWCIIFRCKKRKIATMWQPGKHKMSCSWPQGPRDALCSHVEPQHGSCSSLESAEKNQPGDDSLGGFALEKARWAWAVCLCRAANLSVRLQVLRQGLHLLSGTQRREQHISMHDVTNEVWERWWNVCHYYTTSRLAFSHLVIAFSITWSSFRCM